MSSYQRIKRLPLPRKETNRDRQAIQAREPFHGEKRTIPKSGGILFRDKNEFTRRLHSFKLSLYLLYILRSEGMMIWEHERDHVPCMLPHLFFQRLGRSDPRNH